MDWMWALILMQQAQEAERQRQAAEAAAKAKADQDAAAAKSAQSQKQQMVANQRAVDAQAAQKAETDRLASNKKLLGPLTPIENWNDPQKSAARNNVNSAQPDVQSAQKQANPFANFGSGMQVSGAQPSAQNQKPTPLGAMFGSAAIPQSSVKTPYGQPTQAAPKQSSNIF